MKSLNLLFILFILISLKIETYILNPESSIKTEIEIPKTEYCKPKIVFDYCSRVIIVTDTTLNVDRLKLILLDMGYNVTLLRSAFSDCWRIKEKIDSVLFHIGSSDLILIVGDEYRIEPFRYRINPYTLKIFSSDIDYGILQSRDIGNAIITSRIPAKSQNQLDGYTDNLTRFLTASTSTELINIAPFYDYDNDSACDYNYYTNSYYSSVSIDNSFILGETNSSYPKYLNDGSIIADSLRVPNNDWKLDVSRISLFDYSKLLTYRGHGNAVSALFPQISLSDMTEITLTNGGIFLGLTCLLASFDSITSGYKSSFSESLLFSKYGAGLTLSSSTETFYQYNSIMHILIFDHLSDIVSPIYATSHSSFFPEIYYDVKTAFFSLFGQNDYSVCQIAGYQIFGIPLIDILKQKSSQPFFVSDSFNLEDSIIFIDIFEDNAKISINDGDEIYDTISSFSGKFELRMENINTSKTYYVSSYYKSNLFVDSFKISQSYASVAVLSVSDEYGDRDSVFEYNEKLLIRFSVDNSDENPVRISSNDCYVADSIIMNASACDSAFIILNKITPTCRIVFQIGENIFYHTIEVAKTSVNFVSVKSPDNPFIFVNNQIQLYFMFTVSNHRTDSISIEFLPSTDYFVFNPSQTFTEIICDTFLLWSDCIFYNDTLDIRAVAKSQFMEDTLEYKLYIHRNDILRIYDPTDMYFNSDFLFFVSDSLGITVISDNTLEFGTFYPFNILSFGRYPYVKHITSLDVSYIKYLSSQNASIFLEGSDVLGYDKEGRNLHSLFGLSSASDGITMYDKEELLNTPLNEMMVIDTTIKYTDIYHTQSPFLFNDSLCVGGFYGNNYCQSIPVKYIKHSDKYWMYYMYVNLIMNFKENIEYDKYIFISDSIIVFLKNRSSNPIMIRSVFKSQGILSAEFIDGRIVQPECSISILIKSNVEIPNTEDSIVFSSGFDDFTVNVFKNVKSVHKHNIAYRISGNSIEIPFADETAIIKIPVFKKDGIFISRKQGAFRITGDINLLSGKKIYIVSAHDTSEVVVFIPVLTANELNEKQNIYDVSGRQILKIRNGIYFSDRKKFLNL